MERVVGIDISKARLDAYCLERGQRLAVSNDAPGITELVAWLAPGSLVVMEASGGDERPVHRLLAEHGVEAAVVDPARVRHFAKATGLLAKTDALDAAAIARYGALAGPAPTPLPAEARQTLAELLAYRRQLLDRAYGRNGVLS
jgi:transposase